MKYDKEYLEKLFSNEPPLWTKEDLEWFNQELIHKLQNNQLPTNEKDKLITMMANDQSMMNKYLELKQKTADLHTSIIQKIAQLFISKKYTLVATALAFIAVVILSIKQGPQSLEYDPEVLRGATQADVFPKNNSKLKNKPNFFIINNSKSDALKIQLERDHHTLWISQKQKSNKYYLPLNIKNQLTTGQYTWKVLKVNNTLLQKHEFSIQ